ncbi:hypothetical protein GCM10027299_29320 [Larkinella ripae]
MDQETSDLWWGAGILALFLLVVYGVGKLLAAINQARFRRIMAPLAPIVNGKIDGDFNKGWMEGQYRGRTFWMVMFPKRNVYSGESGFKYNSFTITLKEEPGQHDWSLNYGNANLLDAFRGKQQWYVVTENATLRHRLENPALIAELEATVQGWGQGRIVAYTRSNASLAYEADVSPRLIPTEEQFRAKLDLLLRLAEINAQTNSSVA